MLNFSQFSQFRPTKGFVSDLVGLLELVLVFPLAVFYSTEIWLSKLIKSTFPQYGELYLAIRGDKTLMNLNYNFLGSKFTKVLISQLWLAPSCSNCRDSWDVVQRMQKCKNLGAGLPRRYRTVLNKNSVFLAVLCTFRAKLRLRFFHGY